MQLGWQGVAAAMIAILPVQAAAAGGAAPQAAACTLIHDVTQLQAINDNLAGSYCLANDIDAGSVANFPMIGQFSGKFFGNNRVIRNLTITSTALGTVGLFRSTMGGLIRDLRLANVNINVAMPALYVGGLAGAIEGGTTIKNVHVSGHVQCGTNNCTVGGISGALAHQSTITDSSTSVTVIGPGAGVAIGSAGGVIGFAIAGQIARTTATGSVTCNATTCRAGGVAGYSRVLLDRTAATGPVAIQSDGQAGGLIGWMDGGTVTRSHASGAVRGGTGGTAGGLIGLLDGATVGQSYSVGPVTGGGDVGGFLGGTAGATTVTNGYWDTVTSGQATDLAAAGLTTRQLRLNLPAGFTNAWAFTKRRSYPFIDHAAIDFSPPLATLVAKKRIFTFLPIGQRERWQYNASPAHEDAASLATVYTMIARAIGIARGIAKLTDVKIDKYFWDDATETATWAGPVTTRATLGTLTVLAADAPLNGTNVIGEMDGGKLVILRGTHGGDITHWMLGTLYRSGPDNPVDAVIANDPWSGAQVMIDPTTRTVVAPADFPLTGFKVDAYQPVTLQ